MSGANWQWRWRWWWGYDISGSTYDSPSSSPSSSRCATIALSLLIGHNLHLRHPHIVHRPSSIRPESGITTDVPYRPIQSSILPATYPVGRERCQDSTLGWRWWRWIDVPITHLRYTATELWDRTWLITRYHSYLQVLVSATRVSRDCPRPVHTLITHSTTYIANIHPLLNPNSLRIPKPHLRINPPLNAQEPLILLTIIQPMRHLRAVRGIDIIRVGHKLCLALGLCNTP